MNGIKGIILISLLLTAGMTNAQTDFRRGYVINVNGDTLYGEIDYRGDLLMANICRFKINGGKEEVQLTPEDISGYRFADSKYFVSREVMGGKYFLEFLVKGQVNIYFMRDEEGDHYFLEKEGVGISRLPYEETIRYKKGRNYSVVSTTHIGILNVYMSDALKFQHRIQQIAKPEHRSLIKLAEDYHYAVCEDELCIVYEKKLPLLKVTVEGSVGIASYPDFRSQYPLLTGVLLHSWMPKVNEKLSFRTGLLFLKWISEGKETLIYKIPIQLEYLYPRGKIRPKGAFGFNIYRPIFHSIAFMGGVNLNLNNKISIGFNYELDFYSPENYEKVHPFPERILSHSLSTGLNIRL